MHANISGLQMNNEYSNGVVHVHACGLKLILLLHSVHALIIFYVHMYRVNYSYRVDNYSYK